MNGKQLQIGNWVSFDDKPYKVTKVSLDYDEELIDLELDFDYAVADEDVKPIDLTVDILHKSNIISDKEYDTYKVCGCVNKEITHKFDLYKGSYDFDIIVDKNGIWFGYDNYFIKKLKYVHELQNVFSLYNIDVAIII